MTTTTATFEAPAPVVLRGAQRHYPGEALRRMQVVGGWFGRAGAAFMRWGRAGQLCADPSVDVARWSGARR